MELGDSTATATPGLGARADRHHRLHDGLRHHRHRARHRAGQVQEAGRRRHDQDRQQHRAERSQALGYDDAQSQGIVEYIDEHDTIEGAPDLKDEHLPVFDCAFKPAKGARSIHHMGHLQMMAAVQPFISGAISKTINMPEESTVEEIPTPTWRLAPGPQGRRRSTGTAASARQPLSTAPRAKPRRKSAPQGKPRRRKLPDERRAITHKFSVGGHEGYITVGLYEDGMPGEIFLVMAKEGSTISGLMDAFATSVSIALQYGVPLQTLVDKFSHTRFEPSGFTNNPEIPIAKSIMDYIFRWLASKFLSREGQQRAGVVLRDEPDGDDRLGSVERGFERCGIWHWKRKQQ